MKMRRKVIKTSLLVIALMVSMTIPILAVTAKKKEWEIEPIIIDELGIGLPGMPGLPWADYADEPWLKGSGTFEDPYMIKNVVIDAKGSNFFCMMILNSVAYFKIMDCTFSNTGLGPDAGRNAALILASTQNGVIFKNEIFDCGIAAGQGSGIALIASSNNKVQKNFCHDNAGPGIYLQYSNDNVLRQNLCQRNQWGIMISEGSNNNEVTKNECYDNNEYGIFLYLEANNNLITKNECYDNNEHGIFLYIEANNNLITKNDCKENFNSGIIAIQSHGNTISENDCSVNGNGIIIMYSNGNDVIDNVCSENSVEHGILVSNWAADNTIARNKCFKNARSGIVLYNMAYNNMITDNLCYENFESGIVIDSSFLNAVENNLVYGNSYTGMQLYYADNNMIAWNTFTENYIGIQLLYSNGNEITNNVCNENLASGISVESSYGNLITDNYCSENAEAGINLEYSNDNVITQNLCTRNTWGIFVSEWSNNNEVTKNECYENFNVGIVLANVQNGIIFNNQFTGNDGAGIAVIGSLHIVIQKNLCSENGVGIYVNWGMFTTIKQNDIINNFGSGIVIASAHKNLIEENDCNGNSEGIALINVGLPEHSSKDNIIYKNSIEGNTIGVYSDDADMNDLLRNTISQNLYGIMFGSGSEGNTVYHNNIVGNDIQVSDAQPLTNNWYHPYMLEGNFWADAPFGYDLYPMAEANEWEVLTPIEEEISDPLLPNRLGGNRVVNPNETSYIRYGVTQLFSERVEGEAYAPYALKINGTEVLDSVWIFREEVPGYGEPGLMQLFYIKFPPYYLTEELGMVPGGYYEYHVEITNYYSGELVLFEFDTGFTIL